MWVARPGSAENVLCPKTFAFRVRGRVAYESESATRGHFHRATPERTTEMRLFTTFLRPQGRASRGSRPARTRSLVRSPSRPCCRSSRGRSTGTSPPCSAPGASSCCRTSPPRSTLPRRNAACVPNLKWPTENASRAWETGNARSTCGAYRPSVKNATSVSTEPRPGTSRAQHVRHVGCIIIGNIS